jgi:hypothetical protein
VIDPWMLNDSTAPELLLAHPFEVLIRCTVTATGAHELSFIGSVEAVFAGVD